MIKKTSIKKVQGNEPTLFTNSLSPNRQQQQQQTYLLSDSDDLTGSYTSYSSGEYSSVGDVLNNTMNNDPMGKKNIFIKPVQRLNEAGNQFDHGILSQVYKMQGLLEEYQISLTALEIEKADNQQEINKLDKRLKAKGETEERYKEDIWNLELNNQELSQKLNELSQELSKSHFEQTRFARKEILLGQELDQLKASHLLLQEKLKGNQEHHEQEINSLKKLLQSNQKETLSNMSVNNVIETKDASSHMASASASTVSQNEVLSRNNSINKSHCMEIDALKSSLNQAHTIIHTLQSKLEKEKSQRIEVDKLLREAQEIIENLTTDSTCHHHVMLSPSRYKHQPQPRPQQLQTSDSSSSRKSFILHGKSLGDELSLAGSAGNFNSLLSIVMDDIISPTEGSQKVQVSADELTHVDLPSLSNLDMHSSFSSSDKSEHESDDYNEDIKMVVVQNNQHHFGSLLTKPESYFYKSTRRDNTQSQQQEQQQQQQQDKTLTPAALFASTAVESILSSKLELFPVVKKRNSNDDGSVTALTRTMIGDWMWKYTRKVVGSGISENRHRRFFWIHPYTQTLYWGNQQPGASINHSSTKSALVESFVLLDHAEKKSTPPSILIKTPSRGLKIECMDMPSHYAWLRSLQFILADTKEGDTMRPLSVPKLARISSVSKRHYLYRKKSRNNNNDDTFPSTSVMFNNSTLVDLSNNSNSNIQLIKQV